jgi:hypothetical protein
MAGVSSARRFFVNDVEHGIAGLLLDEGLNDLDRLLVPREWDEVPFASRRPRLAFLSHLGVMEQSRVLVVAATEHLDRLIAHADSRGRCDDVLLVSILDWSDLTAPEPEAVIPNFWISTDPARDLRAFRLRPSKSIEAAMLEEWLASADLLRSHEVFDNAIPESDPALRRIYIGQRTSPRTERFVVRS